MQPFPPTPRNVAYALVGTALVLCLVWGHGFWTGQKRVESKATIAEQAANVAKGEADALKAEAKKKDAQIAATDSDLASAKKALAKAEAKLANHTQPTQPVEPGITPDPVTPSDPNQQTIDALNALAAAKKVIAFQDVEITSLTASRDLWKASSEAREREAAGLRIALEAQKSLTKGALWKGRIQGLAIGLGTGYAIGRVK